VMMLVVLEVMATLVDLHRHDHWRCQLHQYILLVVI